jgi:hypothetical protein
MMSSAEAREATEAFGRIQNGIEQGTLKLETKKQNARIADDDLRKQFPGKIDLEKLAPSSLLAYAELRARHDSAVRTLDEADKALGDARTALQGLFDKIMQTYMQG